MSSSSSTAFRALLYGSAAMLLLINIFFFFRALLTTNFVPIVPVVAGVFTAAGLLFIVYAEQKAREADKKDHRRISRVAHQLESPLLALQDDLAGLLASADRLPSDERLKLKRMETKTNVLLENVRDVFLMLQAQEKPLSREQRLYNLCPLIEQVVARAKTLASARNIELVYQPQCTDAPVFVDRQLFLIALTHVIENGLVYTMKPGLVTVSVIREPKTIRITVQDRGIGITSRDHLTVFEPFARGEHAEAYDPDGIGVGLTLSRLIIQDFQGKLTWHSRPEGMGTEFTVILPLAKT